MPAAYKARTLDMAGAALSRSTHETPRGFYTFYTHRVAEEHRFCGVPDAVTVSENVPKYCVEMAYKFDGDSLIVQ